MGHATDLARRVSVRASLLGGRAEARLRRHARPPQDPQAIVLVGGRAFVAYPYRDAEPVPEGVAVMHIADNPEAFGREHAADMALLGDIRQTLAAAAGRLEQLIDQDKVAARLAARAAAAARRQASDAPRYSGGKREPAAHAPTPRCSRRSTLCRKTR